MLDREATFARSKEMSMAIEALRKECELLYKGVNDRVAIVADKQMESKGMRIGLGVAIGMSGTIIGIIGVIAALLGRQ